MVKRIDERPPQRLADSLRDAVKKAAQPPRPFQPAYERTAITDEQIKELLAEFEAEGPRGRYSAGMARRALGGDVSATNALKMLLESRRDR